MRRLIFALCVITLPGGILHAQAIQPEWARKYNGPGINKSDIGTAVVTDALGNAYVAGQISGYGAQLDWMTIKYNAAGIQQWSATYHGPADPSNNYADAIAIDASHNVYVTGFSDGVASYADFATIKYDSSGIQQWVARYNGPANSLDYGRAIAVDDSGNVYVTGESQGGSTLYDFATVKYNSAGIQQWVARFNGPGNNADMPTAIAIDQSHNVYVTGSSILGNVISYATVKYNSAGVQQWSSIYQGSALQTSIANAVGIDRGGFVYVTGRSGESGRGEDIVTVKYDPATGDSVWVQRFNSQSNNADEGYGIAIDGQNNIYVSGASNDLGNGTWGVAAIKYSSSGAQRWASVYTPPGRQSSFGRRIVIDSSGNAYVGGYSYVSTSSAHTEDYLVAKFDSAGVLQWADFYDGPGQDRDEGYGLALDHAGSVLITGFSYAGSFNGSCDYATVKYDPNGVRQWTARYNNPVNSDEASTGLRLGSSGDVYVAGTGDGQGTGKDIVLIKFDSAGDTLWARRYDSPFHSNDFATCLCVDSSGNVYVGGASWSPGFSLDSYLILKYSPSGSLLWSSTYYAGGYGNIARSMAADASGNVYVFGLTGLSTRGYYLVLKYDQNGNMVWNTQLTSASSSAQKVVVDRSGQIIVTGWTFSGSVQEIYTAKLDAGGDTLWARAFSGAGNSAPADLSVDRNGNVYVTGYVSQGSGLASEDYVTLKYDGSGVQQWSATYNGPAGSYDAAASLAVDSLGFVYVTGASFGAGSDYATIKYTAAGDTVWTRRYPGPGLATSLTTDRAGNVVVTGGLRSGTQYNFGTVAYNNDGVLQWHAQYNAHADSSLANPALIADDSGNVYVAGSTLENGTDYDIVLMKYSRLSSAVVDRNSELPTSVSLFQNYPDPFNPSTTIRYGLPRASFVTLTVYNALGQQVAQLVNERQEAGFHEATFHGDGLASGVYFYRLGTASFTSVKKLLLLK